jgi:hypothetical protein
MELKDFVAQALIEIASGVVQAQEALAPIGAKVNPQLSRVLPKGEKNYEVFGWAEGEGSNPILLVSFDVAVTASEGTKTRGGIGVMAGIVSLGSAGATDKAETAVSRLSFKVPLLLPLQTKK